MSRSLRKGPFVDAKLLRKVMQQKETSDRKPIKTWARACTVIPEFVSHTFLVHNGKDFRQIYGTENMVGHKPGEVAPTGVFRGHTSGRAKTE